MHKVKITTDTLNETGLQTWNAALNYISEYLPYSEDTISVPAEIQAGPDGIEIYVWSNHPQSFFD